MSHRTSLLKKIKFVYVFHITSNFASISADSQLLSAPTSALHNQHAFSAYKLQAENEMERKSESRNIFFVNFSSSVSQSGFYKTNQDALSVDVKIFKFPQMSKKPKKCHLAEHLQRRKRSTLSTEIKFEKIECIFLGNAVVSNPKDFSLDI